MDLSGLFEVAVVARIRGAGETRRHQRLISAAIDRVVHRDVKRGLEGISICGRYFRAGKKKNGGFRPP
jgi:hypothetical protein